VLRIQAGDKKFKDPESGSVKTIKDPSGRHKKFKDPESGSVKTIKDPSGRQKV
jgi:hypothetical protein